MATGDVTDIGQALALPLMQGTVQSPRVMGGTNYFCGWAAGKIGQSTPAKAVGAVTSPGSSAATTNTLAGGVSGATEKMSAPFHLLNIGRAMATGDVTDIGQALALPLMQGTVQSPRVMGATNYLVDGRRERLGNLLQQKQWER